MSQFYEQREWVLHIHSWLSRLKRNMQIKIYHLSYRKAIKYYLTCLFMYLPVLVWCY